MSLHRRLAPVIVALSLVLAWVVAPTGAAAHPGGHPGNAQQEDGLGVVVNAPDELAGFLPAVQWGDSGEVADQTADLVYAGTGCTPASYATVATEIRGNIAIVDSRASETNPADRCPTYTFMQKAQSAEQAGAIGLVQVPAEGEEPNESSTVVTADIPVLEVERTEHAVEVRDAVIEGTAVNVTLTKPGEIAVEAMADVPCEGGMAGPFECEGIDLLAFVPAEDFNGAGQSDLWGWTDPETGDEYVIIGKTNGVAFFRVTEPTSPVYLGELPNTAAVQLVWHDIKVYDNHAFIVSESEPHGMVVFDLTRLRGVEDPQTWNRDGFYPLPAAAHNVEVNTETGFAYIVGGNAGLVAPDQCLSGLHMVDINNPKQPRFAGCYLEEGGPGTLGRSVGGPVEENSPAAYVHDAQCVIYDGPDERYTGREICFNSAETKLVIADVTNKLVPVTLGVTDYPLVGYAHQGWLTEDHAYLIANDELDEMNHEEIENTRTIVFDVTDLENPKVHFEHFHDTRSADHNNYVHEGRVYQSNYSSGLRVLDTSRVADRSLTEIGFFDTFPEHSDPTFDGTWSNYPFFESGTIAVSGRQEGLFLVRLAEDTVADPTPTVPPRAPGPEQAGPEQAGEREPPDDPERRDDPEQADERAEPVTRMSGPTRFETAAAISRATFAPGVSVAFVATGLKFADALAGGPAAIAGEGPVLLTLPDRVPGATAEELQRLEPERVVVLGGPGAISDAVVAELEQITGADVDRLWGTTRFETAVEVSRATFAPGSPVYVATGLRFPDALAGGVAAGLADGPVLVVLPDAVPDGVAAELERLNPPRITVLGGPSAISPAVEEELRGYAPVTRQAGSTRFGTAAAVSEATFPLGSEMAFVATGQEFADALAAVPAAGLTGGPILLVGRDVLPGDTARELDRLGLERIVVLGGPGAVSDDVAEQVSPYATPR